MAVRPPFTPRTPAFTGDLLLASRLARLRQIPGDELTFRIDVRVNSVELPKLTLHKFDRNVIY
jgi:hypothetical protein